MLQTQAWKLIDFGISAEAGALRQLQSRLVCLPYMRWRLEPVC
jgi:hypothetical protein